MPIGRKKFEEVETTKEYDGYYYEAAEVISIVVLGILCGLKDLKQVQQWADAGIFGNVLNQVEGQSSGKEAAVNDEANDDVVHPMEFGKA